MEFQGLPFYSIDLSRKYHRFGEIKRPDEVER